MEPERGVGPEAFRDALAGWAQGVAVVAVREDARVLATTVSSLTSVSLEPPLVALALGAGAQALPFLEPGRAFAVSVLAETQRRLATVFADAYPVGPSPFPPEGDPFVADAIVRLRCRVASAEPAGDHTLVLARVERAERSPGAPLVRFERGWHRLADAPR